MGEIEGRSFLGGQTLAAVAAEFIVQLEGGPAMGAREERCPTFAAELLPLGVFSLAFCALHGIIPPLSESDGR